MKKDSELKVITSTKKLIDYVLTITEKSPKKYRYSFINKIHNLLFEIIECLYKANNERLGNINREIYQKEAIVKLQLLDYFCDISVKEKCIIFKQYENITEMINTIMKLLNSWIASDKKRINNSNNN